MYSSTQQVDDRWDDYFAKSDDIRERYASEMADLKADSLAYEEEMRYRQVIMDAGYPGTIEGVDQYESAWSRTIKYGEKHGY